MLQSVDDVMGNGFPQELDGRVEIVGVGGDASMRIGFTFRHVSWISHDRSSPYVLGRCRVIAELAVRRDCVVPFSIARELRALNGLSRSIGSYVGCMEDSNGSNPAAVREGYMGLRLWFGVTLDEDIVGQTRSHRNYSRSDTNADIASGLSNRPLSLSTLALDDHECQDDIVQHMHPRRSYHESCLSLLEDVVCPVKFSDHGLLLVCCDQLGNAFIRQNISAEASQGAERGVPWDNSFPSHPSPICTERHPVQ